MDIDLVARLELYRKSIEKQRELTELCNDYPALWDETHGKGYTERVVKRLRMNLKAYELRLRILIQGEHDKLNAQAPKQDFYDKGKRKTLNENVGYAPNNQGTNSFSLVSFDTQCALYYEKALDLNKYSVLSPADMARKIGVLQGHLYLKSLNASKVFAIEYTFWKLQGNQGKMGEVLEKRRLYNEKKAQRKHTK